ncbi:MAG: LemA [Prolixibacteraceae bacterium]|nr:MAG: LemA [Prolixibacteraceae bacterium]
MKRMRFVLLAALVAILFSSCGYNKMVEMEEQVTSQWAQVENVYQRRADLIPNLVNTVKGYAAHERETLEGVIEARSKATSVNIDPKNLTPESIQQFNQAQDGLSSALSRLMVVVERYPDLKANQSFLDLQAQLEGTENRITVERQKFNQATQTYNAYIRKFPQVIYAGWFGFDKKTYFEAQQGADKAPEVQF